MPLTVRTLCNLTNPIMVPVAGLAGIDNRVEWVVSNEHLKPGHWLRGGEFNLMLGTNFTDDPTEMQTYIDHLYAGGVAGIGFGIGLRYDAVPQPIIERGNALGFPICELPYELAFASITRSAAEFLFQEKNAGKPRTIDPSGGLVDAALDGAVTLQDIALRISSSLLCNVVIRDHHEGILARSVLDSNINYRHVRRAHARRSIDSIAVELDRTEDELTESELSFLDEMIFAAKIATKVAAAVRREHDRLSVNLIRAIREDSLSLQETARRLFAFGIDRQSSFVALAGRLDAADDGRAGRLSDLVVGIAPGALPAANGAEFEAIVPLARKSDFEVLARALAREATGYPLGLSGVVDLRHLPEALRKARQLLRLGRAGVLRSADLSIEDLIRLVDPAVARDLIDPAWVRKLTPELRDTMRVLLACGYNMNLAAERLALHRHTLRARVERFIDCTGLDVRDPVNRQRAWLMLELLDIAG